MDQEGTSPRNIRITRPRNMNVRNADAGSARTELAESGNPSIVRQRRNVPSDTYSADEIENEETTVSDNAPNKRRSRISLLMGLALTFIAVFFDVAEFGLDLAGTAGAGVFVVIGFVKDVVAFFFFPVVFLLLKVPLWKGRNARKKVVTQITTILVEALPWVGAFMPGTTIGVIVVLLFTWAEDRAPKSDEELNKFITRSRRVDPRIRRR